MTVVKLAKSALRKQIDENLGLIPKGKRIRQSEVVREKLFALDQFKQCKHVSIFLSLDSEVDTEPILRKLFRDGKRCFVPRYNKKVMEMVELYSMDDWSTLPVTKWNIKQPAFEDNRANALNTGLDLIITPGCAFTKDGHRLGHGGGYYDRYFKDISEKQTTPPFIIGVAFKEQIMDELPIEETDFKIDMVLYDDS